METSNYSDEFKRDAVQQIRVGRYPVGEVSQLLGVSSHSLYNWMKVFAEPAPKVAGVDHEAENRRLKRELAQVTEERDILKKPSRAFARLCAVKTACAMFAGRRGVAVSLLVAWTPLKNVARRLMRT